MNYMNCLPFLALAIATRWDYARDGTSNYQGWDGFRLGFQPMFHYVSIDVHGTSLNRRCQAFDGHLATALVRLGSSTTFGKKHTLKHTNLPELLKTLNKKTHPTYGICHKIYCTIYIRQEIPQRFHRFLSQLASIPSPFLQLQTTQQKRCKWHPALIKEVQFFPTATPKFVPTFAHTKNPQTVCLSIKKRCVAIGIVDLDSNIVIYLGLEGLIFGWFEWIWSIHGGKFSFQGLS